MIERANNPAELRQLLKEEGLADNLLLGFDDEDLQKLLDKGLRTRGLLNLADVAALERPPALLPILTTALLRKFNPAALTASPGGWLRAA